MAPNPPGPPLGPPTPLPRGPFTAIVLMYLSNSLSLTILFPFVAYMVKSFHVTEDVSKLGYYAGLLGSSAFFGAFLSGAFWGALSDRIGRKPVLLIGLLGNTLTALTFGLSVNLEMAITVRFTSGLLSTIAATGRTSVAELCDRSNMARGFSVLGTMFGVGFLIGPAIGGFLCEPAQKYPGLFPGSSLFAAFPYLLPCLVLAIFSLIALLATATCLPETLGQGSKVQSRGGLGRSPGPSEEAKDTEAGGSGQAWNESSGGVREPLLVGRAKPEGGRETPPRLPQHGASELWGRKVREVLLRRNTVVATLLFAVITFVSSAFNEVFPLWCLTPWSLGGLSWGTNLVGLAQTSAGIALIPLQLYLYAPLVERVGPVTALRVAVSAGVLVLLFPLVRLFGEGTLGLVAATCLLQAVRSFPQCVFTSIYMLIAKSVKNPRDLGFVNGASQSMSVIFMAMAPESSASLFAWSTGVHGRLINTNLWFVFITCLYLSMIGLTCFMDPLPEEG